MHWARDCSSLHGSLCQSYAMIRHSEDNVLHSCRGVKITKELKTQRPDAKLKEWGRFLESEGSKNGDVIQLQQEVVQFASQFPMPGL